MIASDSGHWYTRDGEPAYTQPNKSKGGERPTTVRDARKLDLVPSVTTILKMAAAPALERWKQEQLLMSALTLPAIEGETLTEYAARVREDAAQQGKDARDEGTRIHGLVERYFQTGEEMDSPYVENAIQALSDAFGEQEWRPEKSFACDLGFGGKIDLYSDTVIVDYKTKDFDRTDRSMSYLENKMQLSAYRKGLGMDNARIANLFISRSVPGLVKLEIHDGDWWPQFECLLNYWKLTKL